MHHEVTQCLLKLRNQAEDPDEFDGESIQLWVEYELEALRWGVDPDVSREELESLLSDSTVEVSREEHGDGHAGNFVYRLASFLHN